MIFKKVGELAYYLPEKEISQTFRPRPVLERDNSAEMRESILNMSHAEWKKMGHSKGTLHYLKKEAKSEKPFNLYEPIKRKLDSKA